MKLAPIISLALLLALAACGSQSTPAATPTAENSTVTPTQTKAVALAPTASPTATVTSTPKPTATATPDRTATATSSPTAEPERVAQVDETLTANINVRSGPGTGYPVVTQFEPGHEAFVVGQNEEESWWQVSLTDEPEEPGATGWIFGELVSVNGNDDEIPVVQAPPLPTATPVVEVSEIEPQISASPLAELEHAENDSLAAPASAEELADTLRCGKDFCVTYQAMVPIWENGGCVGNHSIYITVLEGLPPGKPMDRVVVGDTFNNVEVGSGSHGPGRTEITLWNNSMTLKVKRHMDGTPYTSEESFNFTAHDELIPAEVLAANGYCEGRVEKCREAQQHNQVCRGHYSWRVTFHKFD